MGWKKWGWVKGGEELDFWLGPGGGKRPHGGEAGIETLDSEETGVGGAGSVGGAPPGGGSVSRRFASSVWSALICFIQESIQHKELTLWASTSIFYCSLNMVGNWQIFSRSAGLSLMLLSGSRLAWSLFVVARHASREQTCSEGSIRWRFAHCTGPKRGSVEPPVLGCHLTGLSKGAAVRFRRSSTQLFWNSWGHLS